MTPDQIASLEPALSSFLGEFADCFGRSEPRRNLECYVRGQLSDMPRKSIEPMALAAEIAPRTLQVFLADSKWDHVKLRDHMQFIIARDHGDAGAVLILDETSFVKKGDKTPGVQRQYCGSVGKLDNGVVTVHAAYFVPTSGFRTLLDSDLFLPETSWSDPARRREARIPDDLAYRPKYKIAIEQIERARANGIPFEWVTADEGYGGKRDFVDFVDSQPCSIVLELPRNSYGWFIPPLTTAGAPAKRIDSLCRHSDRMARQAWTAIRVKSTEKGDVVWEGRSHSFWMAISGKIRGPYTLIQCRNALDHDEVKYFLAKARTKTPLEKLLYFAFARHPIERCFEDGKTEIGMGHFEVRNYPSLIRHCYISQLTHLFLAKQTQRLRGEKPGDYHLPGSDGGRRRRLGTIARTACSRPALPENS